MRPIAVSDPSGFRPHLDASQPFAPVARYLGFAVAVVPLCGTAGWWAIVIPFMSSAATAGLVALAVPIVGASLVVIARAGIRRGYPWWLVAAASVGALVMVVPCLFAVGFGIVAVSCGLFNELCLGCG